MRQQIGHKQFGERMLLMQDMKHGLLIDAQDGRVFHGRRGRRANRVSGEAGFSKKCPLFQNGDNGFFALLRYHGQLDLACLDIEHGLRHIRLRKDRVFLGGYETCFTFAHFAEKQLRVKD